MTFRFYRRFKVLPGVHVNVGKTLHPTVTIGKRGYGVTLGRGRVRTHAGIPGTGLGWTETYGGHGHQPVAPQPMPGGTWGVARRFGLFLLGVAALFAIAAMVAH